jgi:mannose-6-phosphate isomerase
MIWGGRRLADNLNKVFPDKSATAYGESWEVSDHAIHASVVATGPLAGKSIRQLMEQDQATVIGPRPLQSGRAKSQDRFPWLIKFLDANDWLSVQVHPDEKAVVKLWPGECSKTEAWFIVDAAPGSRIFAGMRSGVDERRLRSALASDKVTDCLHSFEPQPGDCVFLPAGTVHAVGGGVLIAEVQQTSDATFRLFDWNRHDSQGKSRVLHIEESLASIHWDQGPIDPVRVTDFKQPAGPSKDQELVRCPFFGLRFLRTTKSIPFGGSGLLQALLILQGRGRWHSPNCSEEMKPGQVWVLTASLPQLECLPDPSLSMLVCTNEQKRS